MKIHYTQNEALVRYFYENMYFKLPLYRNRRMMTMGGMTLIALVLAGGYALSKFVLFAVVAAVIFVVGLVQGNLPVSKKRIDKIVFYHTDQYGDNIPSEIEFEEKEIIATNDKMVKNYFVRYDELTSAVYDDKLFCITTAKNAYFFPLETIREGKDALLDWLRQKNPSIKVVKL